MRAVVCHEFTEYRNLKVEPFPDPELRDGHVLIDTHAAGLGFATSLWVAGRYQRKPPLPFVPKKSVSQNRQIAVLRSGSRPLQRLQPVNRQNTAGLPAFAPSP